MPYVGHGTVPTIAHRVAPSYFLRVSFGVKQYRGPPILVARGLGKQWTHPRCRNTKTTRKIAVYGIVKQRHVALLFPSVRHNYEGRSHEEVGQYGDSRNVLGVKSSKPKRPLHFENCSELVCVAIL